MKPQFGSSALHIAAERGFENIVKILLDYGASTRDKDSSGSAPSGAATKNGNFFIPNWSWMRNEIY